jgi:hypothetical protein
MHSREILCHQQALPGPFPDAKDKSDVPARQIQQRRQDTPYAKPSYPEISPRKRRNEKR